MNKKIDQFQEWLIDTIKPLQMDDNQLTDGVIIAAMANIQGKLIGLHPAEDRPKIIESIHGLLQLNSNIVERN